MFTIVRQEAAYANGPRSVDGGFRVDPEFRCRAAVEGGADEHLSAGLRPDSPTAA